MAFTSSQAFGQINSEVEILNLSNQVFKWEVENNINAIDSIFHEKFVVVGSDGNSQSKGQYLPKLKSGSFIHNSIIVEENSAIVNGNTAVVYGKGKFDVTVAGKKILLRLSYNEVFTRDDKSKPWKVLAMKASTL